MNDKMDDKEQLAECYHTMYQGMITKSRPSLEQVLDDSFVLLHMTGMRQNKQEYITAILNKTLNYYSEKTVQLSVSVYGSSAQVIGQSKVTAAVFGGGRHTWNLQLTMKAEKMPQGWRFTWAEAAVW